MVSSLANAIKRHTHKERSQPAARRKYGLLEKRKDYLQRARDFHKKEDTIKRLKRKAEERNPDEFYFAMEKARTKNGIHDGSLNKANKYSADELALMRSQDVNYLNLKRQVESEKVEAIQESLHYLGLPAQNKHKVFVDSSKEALTFDPSQYFGTPKAEQTSSSCPVRSVQLSLSCLLAALDVLTFCSLAPQDSGSCGMVCLSALPACCLGYAYILFPCSLGRAD
ncbi:Utp11 protein-domain-containing protein [Dunaliella salina]|uniref:Utp11 protein-domain-containing protein n=1 Tax=Dunaliella salina TaxID=3046 RepID=A0ABQ7H9C4_DUNSA|nr:Utp11 protein-domain-containing protein [Dunaliella salina]|eukprot:KAF5843453.1 Utp11 protein-domain-containing protein [Dunaliella salina]